MRRLAWTFAAHIADKYQICGPIVKQLRNIINAENCYEKIHVDLILNILYSSFRPDLLLLDGKFEFLILDGRKWMKMENVA